MRSRAGALLAAVVLLNLGLVAIAVLLTYWQRAFYNSLEARDWNSFINLLMTWDSTEDGWMPGFGPILAVHVALTAYALYLKQALQIHWREWMTDDYIDRWLSGRHYYLGSLGIGMTDNPDQRIAEDIDLFVDGLLTLGLGFMRSVVSLISFVILLWSLSETIVLFGIQVPGYLVWLALLYAGLGTIGTHFFGFRLIDLQFHRQRVEADFRYGLIQVRDNAEGVALHNGEENEKRSLSRLFTSVATNWRRIMSITKQMTLFTSTYNQAALVFPLAISAPAYFAGRMPLGGVFQTAGAFVQVQVALSWVVDNYAKITELAAAIQRLRSFQQAQELAAVQDGAITIVEEGDSLVAQGLAVHLPDGRCLIEGAELLIEPRDSVLITGASGTGKSALVRTFAGIWPYGGGYLQKPQARFLFLPQKPYLPIGILRRVMTYPLEAHCVTDAELRGAFDLVGLGHLINDIDREENWRVSLSGGELQRLAIARALLLKPEWLILDEATASLDLEWERRVYLILKEKLPDATIITVAHRLEALLHHRRVFLLKSGRLSEARHDLASANE